MIGTDLTGHRPGTRSPGQPSQYWEAGTPERRIPPGLNPAEIVPVGGGNPPMSVDDNKRIVREAFDSIWNEGEYPVEAFTEDYVAHGWAPEPVDLAQERADTAAFRGAFPDIHKEIEDLFAEGDRVALRYRFTGTHEGEFEGIEPTGEEVSTSGIFIYRMDDGRIAESWLNYDGLNLLGQLGAL